MPKVVYLSYVWPEQTSSAAGVRSYQLVRALGRLGYEIHLASPSLENSHTRFFESLGVITHSIQANSSHFDHWILELNPEVVLYDRFVMEEQFGWRVRGVVPNALEWIDSQDLHCLRRGRERLLKAKGDTQSAPDVFLSDDASRELASFLRVDGVWLLSSVEKNLLMDRVGFPSDRLHLLRFFLPRDQLNQLEDSSPPWESRRHLAMIGNFRHPPNADSIRWVHQELWPVIRAKFPWLELHIYGAYPSQDLLKLQSKNQGFLFKGIAPDSKETLGRYQGLLAPLRFGAGIKGKIFDAWQVGTPVITTEIGAEGMSDGVFPGWVVSYDPKDWVQAITEIVANEPDRADHECPVVVRKRIEDAYRLLRSSYSEENAVSQIDSDFSSARDRRNRPDERDYLRRILNHHTTKSLTYFSRWIELKNRL